MLADRLAEGLAHLRIGEGLIQAGLSDADAPGRHVDAPELHAGEDLLQAPALLAADQVIRRHPAVLEHQRAGVDAAIAELVELADRNPVALFGQQKAHPLMRRVGAGIGLDQHRDDVTVNRVGDPHLGAVDDVVIAVPDRAGGDGLEIGAAVRFGQGDGAPELAAGEAGKVALLLPVGAEAFDHRRHDQMGVEDAGDGHPRRRDPLDDPGVGHGAEAQPAIFRRHGGAEQAEFLHLLDDFAWIGVGGLELMGDGLDVARDESLDAIEDQRLLLVGHRPRPLNPRPPRP